MTEELSGRLLAEHRRLDELFGGFLAAVSGGDALAATAAIERFDEELRRHMTLEEDRIYPAAASEKLSAPQAEDARARGFRELRLEHVQIRELSAMIRRLLSEKRDLEGARRLAANLARRWDAHTAREERHLSSEPEPSTL